MEHALELIRRLDDAVRRGRPRGELDSLFDTLLEAYSALSEDDRKRVRDAYNKCSHWGTFEFWMKKQSPILQFKQTGGIDNLRRALAHYSLSDGYPDARDAIVGMSDLLVAADRHGIDAGLVFSEIAAVSNPDGTWSLQKYMRTRD